MIKLGLWKCLHCWNGSPKKWWTLPSWLFSTLQRCRLLKSIFCMSERERVQIFPVVPGWTVKRLPLWLYWGSKSLVATCKNRTPEFVGVPIMSACDWQGWWRGGRLLRKWRWKSKQQKSKKLTVGSPEKRMEDQMAQWDLIFLMLMIDADVMNTKGHYIAIYVYNNDKMTIIHIGIRRWKWLPYLRSSSQEASQSLDINLRSGMGCWWHVHLERPVADTSR